MATTYEHVDGAPPGAAEPDLDLGDLVPQEVSVKLGPHVYLLVEASEDAAVEWRNAHTKQVKLTDGKVSGLGAIADCQALLVARCLFRRNPNGTRGQQVPVALIRSWPARVVRDLFERVKRMSDLEERKTRAQLEEEIAAARRQLDDLDGGDVAKKAPGAGDATSDSPTPSEETFGN